MFYRILADITVIVHVAYVLFVVLGVVLILLGWLRKWQWVRNPWFRYLHLTMILVVVAEAWCGITCPLTTWEKDLRRLAGQQTYGGDFIANFLHEALFFDAPDWVFTLCYTAFALLVGATFLLAPPRGRRRESSAATEE